MAKSVPKMIGDVCPRCMRPHGPPVCDHDPDRICKDCGLTVGYLWDKVEGDTCWFCVMGEKRPGPKPVSQPRQDEEFEF